MPVKTITIFKDYVLKGDPSSDPNIYSDKVYYHISFSEITKATIRYVVKSLKIGGTPYDYFEGYFKVFVNGREVVNNSFFNLNVEYSADVTIFIKNNEINEFYVNVVRTVFDEILNQYVSYEVVFDIYLDIEYPEGATVTTQQYVTLEQSIRQTFDIIGGLIDIFMKLLPYLLPLIIIFLFVYLLAGED